ncbi:PPC domain-containing protein [Microcoleus sp. FACHB-1515]|uniref:PPC domain-containing protein n=1 Tax=Cyanophyceae TaxID=3028117 RepID=UPI001682E6BF|nr:PPC domain-containing protein [Microcoleus sp. FACHB-1515]MBD2090242.1 PPC domain-containing protein [Microcoleus sp. FACHB-1515]
MNRRSDNTFGGARTLQFNRTIRDSVGQRDRIDIYKFTASGSSNFSMSLSGLRGNANVRLLNNRSRTIAASNQRRNRPERIGADLEAGTYYLQVQYVDRRGTTPYRLQAALTPSSNPNPDPEPPLPPPVGDDSIATAIDIGTLTTTTVKEEFVGPEDPVDFFKFTLNDIANVEVRVEELSGSGTFELIRDDNNNGLVDTGEIYRSSFGSFSPIDMPSGTYFLRASSNSATRYRLTFVPTLFGGNVSPDPGSTLATAFDLGIYSGTRSIKEYIGAFDTADIYRFTLNDLSNLQINTGNNNLTVQLYRDDNSNGLIDDNETYHSSASNLNVDMPSGNYFLGIVQRFSNSAAAYEMTLVGTPYGGNGLPDPGNTLPTARDLGVLNGTSSRREYVGNFDLVDFYRFTLNNAANFQARLNTSNASTSLFRDANNNGLIDSGEELSFGTSRDLQAGTYFLQVARRFSNLSTNYQLDLIAP